MTNLSTPGLITPSPIASCLPKLDPHIHFEGIINQATIASLALRNNKSLSQPTAFQNGRSFCQPSISALEGKPVDFSDFAALYVKASEVTITEMDYLTVVDQYLDSCIAEGVGEAHMYFSIQTHLLLGRSQTHIIDNLLLVADRAKSRGFRIAWIFDAIRGVSDYLQSIIPIAEVARTRGLDVFAIGLGGDETRSGPGVYQSFFSEARSKGFESIVHCGEMTDWSDVNEAITKLKPSRISHALSAIDNTKVIDTILKNEIIVELCPCCNITLGCPPSKFAEKTTPHPILQFIKLGVPIVIGSDDPGFIGKSLSDNFQLCLDLGVTEAELEKIRLRALSLRK